MINLKNNAFLFQIPMEGETSELDNLDSELVMSFYDQYHADDMSKVYGDISSREEDTGVLDLKNNLALSLIPDVTPQTSQVRNNICFRPAINLLLGHKSCHKKLGLDQYSRFVGYWA